MTAPISEVTKTVVEHKVTIGVLAVTGYEKLWLEWGTWIVDMGYSVGSMVLVWMMIYKTYKGIKGKNQNKLNSKD